MEGQENLFFLAWTENTGREAAEGAGGGGGGGNSGEGGDFGKSGNSGECEAEGNEGVNRDWIKLQRKTNWWVVKGVGGKGVWVGGWLIGRVIGW